MLIDTHVHLNDDRLLKNLDDILARAMAQNVTKMIVIGYDVASSKQAIQLAETYPFIYANIGIHPSDVHKAKEGDLEWIKENLHHEKVIAIGEIGLDYYWSKEHKELQIKVFKAQLACAKEFDLPVAIHSRDAMQDTYDILKEANVQGVMHCYSGSSEMAKEFVKLGFFIGIGGVVTFKNAKEIKEVVEVVPLTHILSETDAPYLAPHPYRGKMNEPSYIPLIVEKIAELKEIQFSDVEIAIETNVKRLYGI